MKSTLWDGYSKNSTSHSTPKSVIRSGKGKKICPQKMCDRARRGQVREAVISFAAEMEDTVNKAPVATADVKYYTQTNVFKNSNYIMGLMQNHLATNSLSF